MASRGADAFRAAFVRPLMLVLWCGVLWGSFVVLSWAWVLVSDGTGPAVQAMGRLSWPNRVSGLLALSTWLVGAAIWWQRRAAGDET
jgi:hypothetical protein